MAGGGPGPAPAPRAGGAGRLADGDLGRGAVGGLEVERRHHTQLLEVVEVPLPVGALCARRPDHHPRLERLVPLGAEGLQRPEDGLAARPDLLGPAAVWGYVLPLPGAVLARRGGA